VPGPARTPGSDDEPFAGFHHVAELTEHHLLTVPEIVDPEQVGTLVRARLPYTDLARTGQAVIGRYSRLSGPYHLTFEEAMDAAVPLPWSVVYALDAPVEREDPPAPGADDRDGFAFAFPNGLPWREEARGLHLLVSLARRLNGAARAAGSFELIQPDPRRAVDHVVHSPYWLEPDVLCGVVARELPTAHLAIEGEDWAGPPAEAYTGELVAIQLADDPMQPEQLAVLHEMADTADLSALAADDVIDAFAVIGDVGPNGRDGRVEVRARLGESDEPSVVGQPWAESPFVTYEIRWDWLDRAEREKRLPGQAFLRSRVRVAPVISAVTRAVVEAASGIVTDEDGFWVDRYAL
jgi:hypothetical protein